MKAIGSILAVLGLAAMLAIAIVSSYVYASSSNTLTANVNVGNVIYIALTPTSINLGNVIALPDSFYTNSLIIDTDNGGNLEANILVYGSNFISASNSIYVSNTLWNPTSLASYAGNALTLTSFNTGIQIAQPSLATPSESNSIYFGFNIPLGTPVGLYTQTLTLQNSNTLDSVSSSTATVTVTANVEGSCSISLPTSLGFGSIYASANTPTNNVVTDTDSAGNAQANVLVEGTDWSWAANSVSNTLWNPTSVSAYTGNALTNALVNTGIQVPAPTQTATSQSANVYFGLAIPPGTPGATYTQTITIENSC